MFKKGILGLLVVFSYLGSPVLMAADSADTVDEVVVWWENYGKYWDDAVADNSANDETSVALNDE